MSDKLDTFTNKHADSQLSASGQKQGLFEKDVFKVVIPDKVVTPEEVPNSTQVFNSRFIDEIKDPYTNKAYGKSRLVVQADNDKDKNLELTKLPIIQQACNLNRDFYIRPPSEPILLLGASSNCIVKVIKPLYSIPEAGKNKFTTYHPHYKEKLGITESTKELVTDSAASTFACDSGACATKPGLVTKKGEPPRISLHFISHPLQPPSLLLGSTLSKMRPVMFVCSAISKYATMCEWPFSSALEAKIRTKDREYLTFAQPIKLNGAEMKQVNKRVRNGRVQASSNLLERVASVVT